jgi:Ion channel
MVRTDEEMPLLPESALCGSQQAAPLGAASAKERSLAILAEAVERRRAGGGGEERAARMADVLAEIETDQKQNSWWMAFAIYAVCNHFLSGIVTLVMLEGWSFIDAAYFCVVVTTTVGTFKALREGWRDFVSPSNSIAYKRLDRCAGIDVTELQPPMTAGTADARSHDY